jgi:hypothetical protein
MEYKIDTCSQESFSSNVLPFFIYLLKIHTRVVIIKVQSKIVVFKYFSCL